MQFIKPDWPAPKNVYACTTTRQKGKSLDPYESFNLADHVGDDQKNVESNRQLLAKRLQLPSQPFWLQQTHSNKVVKINRLERGLIPIADASIATTPNVVCVVMTADCLPVLICNRSGTKVSAIHAGWRGLAAGIIENTVKEMGEKPSDLLAWLGPAIGPEAFEVSKDVLEAFMGHDQAAIKAFKVRPGIKDKWLANIYLLAIQRLNAVGVSAVHCDEYCTYSDTKNFYSYRRDGGKTGRMATLIWLSA